MRRGSIIVMALFAALAVSPALKAQDNIHSNQKDPMPADIQPPVAEKRPYSFTRHGITVEDPYHWLKDQSYPKVDDGDVLDYLRSENAYYEAKMAAHKPLIETLFQEMKARIKEDDSTVPQKDGNYIYWSKFDEGAQYRKHYRKSVEIYRDIRTIHGSSQPDEVTEGPDQLILDENELAKGKDYFRLGAAEISKDGSMLAYSYDDNGSERYRIKFRCLNGGGELADELCDARAPWGDDAIEGTLGNIIFTSDGKSLVYGMVNENWRTDKIMLHRLGTPQAEDKLLYHEKNEGFTVGAGLSVQEDWIILSTGDNVTSEVYLIPADNPAAKPILVKAAKAGMQYSVDVRDGEIWVLTNDNHVNFRVAKAKLTSPDQWEEVIAGSDRHYLTGLSLFRDFFVTEGRIDGLDQVELRQYDTPTKAKPIKFAEASYVAGLGDNPEYDAAKLRLNYESMVTPDTVYDYTVATGHFETLKIQEIPSGYAADQYTTERLMVTARDGTQIPVSVVYKKGFKKDGSAPLHLYAYGAYGIAISPGFSAARLSLVDRGFAYAIAHIRGGDDLGYQWYLDGKLTKRTNTFNDFVDVARGLIAGGYTSAGKMTASGGSAGGELMGAVANQAPELFGAIVAHVPFVDVLNTMLDDSLPLTPGEWPEWGNPLTSKADFEYIRSYSPYDQVAAKAYPPMLYTGGLNDPRVTYWEPAKMVAKLRALKTDNNLLLMKINMEAGHGGKSGRWNALQETAEEFAFILWQLGLAQE